MMVVMAVMAADLHLHLTLSGNGTCCQLISVICATGVLFRRHESGILQCQTRELHLARRLRLRRLRRIMQETENPPVKTVSHFKSFRGARDVPDLKIDAGACGPQIDRGIGA